MQLTLLQIVQDMLSAIKAEGVSTVVSGSTTEDALLCVNLANREYENLIYKYKWKILRTYGALSAGASLNVLKGSSTTIYIDCDNIWYGASNEERLIPYVDPETFVQRTISRDSTDTSITVINSLKIYNDRNPTFFTSFDDVNLVFDAMPSAGGLVASNSKAITYASQSARKSANADVFNLPTKVFPYFRDICIGYAMKELEDNPDDGDRRVAFAKAEISKIVASGDLVDVDTDYRKHIRVRNTTGLIKPIDSRIGN